MSRGPAEGDTRELTAYERQALSEIDGWKEEKDGRVTRALNAATLPFGWAALSTDRPCCEVQSGCIPG
ncbi:MAG: hypothetical protein H0V53_05205 [Rubrobacter sp.]|nr:hypothetical protein [Rubrobacter sp.]